MLLLDQARMMLEEADMIIQAMDGRALQMSDRDQAVVNNNAIDLAFDVRGMVSHAMTPENTEARARVLSGVAFIESILHTQPTMILGSRCARPGCPWNGASHADGDLVPSHEWKPVGGTRVWTFTEDQFRATLRVLEGIDEPCAPEPQPRSESSSAGRDEDASLSRDATPGF
jgi:hypothetical protein